MEGINTGGGKAEEVGLKEGEMGLIEGGVGVTIGEGNATLCAGADEFVGAGEDRKEEYAITVVEDLDGIGGSD